MPLCQHCQHALALPRLPSPRLLFSSSFLADPSYFSSHPILSPILSRRSLPPLPPLTFLHSFSCILVSFLVTTSLLRPCPLTSFSTPPLFLNLATPSPPRLAFHASCAHGLSPLPLSSPLVCPPCSRHPEPTPPLPVSMSPRSPKRTGRRNNSNSSRITSEPPHIEGVPLPPRWMRRGGFVETGEEGSRGPLYRYVSSSSPPLGAHPHSQAFISMPRMCKAQTRVPRTPLAADVARPRILLLYGLRGLQRHRPSQVQPRVVFT